MRNFRAVIVFKSFSYITHKCQEKDMHVYINSVNLLLAFSIYLKSELNRKPATEIGNQLLTTLCLNLIICTCSTAKREPAHICVL